MINERIKTIRNTLGFTQVKFADKVALSHSYLAEIETGAKATNERLIKLISAEFNVNENWLRTGEGMMFNQDFDAQIAKITSLFKSLNRSFKECAVIQLEGLADLCNLVKDNQHSK